MITEIRESDRWCTLVSEAILFVYGIYISKDQLWNASIAGRLDKASVRDACKWAQAGVLWKTDQLDEAEWPGHLGPSFWPLFWEVALGVDRERTITALGYAFTALAYRDYDVAKDQKAWGHTITSIRTS